MGQDSLRGEQLSFASFDEVQMVGVEGIEAYASEVQAVITAIGD